MSRPSVLHCITVYNGRAFVPAAIESALRIDQSEADIDVLVLDDASPEPGWSEELKEFCAARGARYYLSPRNLGIPRNVNLGLLTAVERGYDYVVISNSDVLYPKGLMSSMLAVSRHKRVGSVTAWSNNVSVYALPNEDPDRYLSQQPTVDWLHSTLNGHFGDAAMDVPAGISFSILIPTRVVRDVGIMDTCFGRGYCEETDWSLRSLKAGYRICLAPGTFVYHKGRGSNLAAGLVSGSLSTVPENEAIIDLRYPRFRTQVDAFVNSGILEQAHSDAIAHTVTSAARQFGYTLEIGWVPHVQPDERDVRMVFDPDGRGNNVTAVFRGFRHEIELAGPGFLDGMVKYFGAKPRSILVGNREAVPPWVTTEFAGKTVQAHSNYPTLV